MLVNIEELKPSRYADTISKSEPETWGNYPNLQLRIWGGQEWGCKCYECGFSTF